MNRIISAINHKGGVGKTTTVHNLGKALTLLDKKVLLVDNDPQANLTTVCNIDTAKETIFTAVQNTSELPIIQIDDNLFLVPSELDYTRAEHQLLTEMNGYFKLKKLLKPLKTKYDFILIDCPPSLGIFTSNAIIASDSVLIVVQSSFLSIKGLQTIVDVIEETKEELNPNIKIEGFLLTQANRTVVRKEMEKAVRQVYPAEVFETTIRQNVTLEEASTQQQDVFDYDKESYGANDYLNLAREILAKE